MGQVYVQANEPQNRVLVFSRTDDGALAGPASYETGGSGNAEPHLPSQGSVVLSGDGRHVLVANVASDDVSVLAVRDDGGLELAGTAPAGRAPTSIAEHDGLVYVLSSADAGVRGFRLGARGLTPIDGSERQLSAPGADPAQVGFTPDGSALCVTERGTDSIVTFLVEADGTLGERQAAPSSGPTPYGFAVAAGGTLVVTEAFRAEKGAAAVSSYAVDGARVTPLTRSLGNGRSEICWAVVTPDGRHVYTTNFADGAVSHYVVEADGSVTLADAAAGLSVDGRPGLRDLGLTGDGRYLYAVDADAGAVFGWAVGSGGNLSPLGSWDGLPATIAGLAAS